MQNIEVPGGGPGVRHPRRRRSVTRWWAPTVVLLTAVNVATGFATPVAPLEAEPLTASDVGPAAGFESVARTWSAKAVDYNRDGREDVWIGYHGADKLWRNTGNGTYRRVAPYAWPKQNANGKTIDRHDCAWADVDRNGRPDAYCSTGRFNVNVVKRGRDNELWLQGRAGAFREVGTQWGIGDACGRGRFVAFLRANGDRYPDLVLGNDLPRDDPDDPCNAPGNTLPNENSKIFINQGGKGFRYAPRFWRTQPGAGSRCVETLDFDRDGWRDLFTCRKYDETPKLYRNQSGQRLIDVTPAQGFTDRVTDAIPTDIDGDGDTDIVTSGAEGQFSYHLNQAGRFSTGVIFGQTATGRGHSVAAGDADLDGDVDIYGMVAAASGNPDDFIWMNDQLTFTAIPVPSAGGTADGAVALRPYGARTWFLGLNGAGRLTHGPLQLIRVR